MMFDDTMMPADDVATDETPVEATEEAAPAAEGEVAGEETAA